MGYVNPLVYGFNVSWLANVPYSRVLQYDLLNVACVSITLRRNCNVFNVHVGVLIY